MNLAANTPEELEILLDQFCDLQKWAGRGGRKRKREIRISEEALTTDCLEASRW